MPYYFDLAIIAITSPSFSKLLAVNERDNRLRLLKTNLMLARIHSIKNRSSVTLCPLISGKCVKQWKLKISIFVDFNSNQELDENDYLLHVIDKINLDHTITYPRYAVTYRSDGSLDGFQSGSFIYCLPKTLNVEGKRITVSQAGRFRLRDTNKC